MRSAYILTGIALCAGVSLAFSSGVLSQYGPLPSVTGAPAIRSKPAEFNCTLCHLPDVKNNRAYVGGPKQYRAYQQFRHEQIVNAENEPSPSPSVQVVEVNEGWAEWDGWGPLGEPGWY